MFGLRLHAAVEPSRPAFPSPVYLLWCGTGAVITLDGDDGPECLDRFAATNALVAEAKDGRDWTLWEQQGANVRLVAAYATDPETAERGLVAFRR